MIFRRNLLTLLLMVLALSACGSTSASPDELAFTNEDESDSITSTELVVESDKSAVDATFSTSTTELTSADPVALAPLESTTATTAPIAVNSSTESEVEANTCSASRYSIDLPHEWSHLDCAEFSPAALYDPDVPEAREWRSEITAAFVTSETFTESIDRINTTMDVASMEELTVDGLPARRILILEEYWRIGERNTVVVDAGDGVFFIAADQLADSNANDLFNDIDERYANTVAAMNQILDTIQITEGTPALTPPVFTGPTLTSLMFSPIHCATGQFTLSEHPGYVPNDAEFSIDEVLLQYGDGSETELAVTADGVYQVPSWTGPQDVAVHVDFSDVDGNYEHDFSHVCNNVFGGSYQICDGDKVSIVYPENLVSNVDLGATHVEDCTFFRVGPEDGHVGHAITLTLYEDSTMLEVRNEIFEFGDWREYQNEPQGGALSRWNLYNMNDATEVIGRAIIIPTLDGDHWVIEGDYSGFEAVEEMAESINVAFH